MPVKIDNDVLDVLRTVQVNGHGTTMPQLDRKLYERTNKFLEMLGGKWDRKSRTHQFDGDPGDRLNDAITTGEVIDAKKEFQFFETPPELAERMVSRAQIQDGHSVLEPSAGKGAILRAIRRAGFNGSVRVIAVEIREGLIEPISLAQSVHYGDFMACNWVPVYDRVLMNPPFRNGQDIAHVRHAYSLMNPGGRMVAITALGWTFRNDDKHRQFREWVESISAQVEELPKDTFKSSGTSIRTMLLVIDK